MRSPTSKSRCCITYTPLLAILGLLTILIGLGLLGQDVRSTHPCFACTLPTGQTQASPKHSCVLCEPLLSLKDASDTCCRAPAALHACAW